MKIFEFSLAKASEIARQNGRQLLAGNHIAPLACLIGTGRFLRQPTPGTITEALEKRVIFIETGGL